MDCGATCRPSGRCAIVGRHLTFELQEQKILTYPQIDPVAFTIPFIDLPVYWYGLSYVAGLLLCRFLLAGQMRRTPHAPNLSPEQQSDLALFYVALGVIIGGRLGSVLFYHPQMLLQPMEIISIHKGGMSFHGGLIGAATAMAIYARTHKCSAIAICDMAAPLAPLALGLGRIANFVNGELWGRPSDWPWAMVFPHVDHIPRHPSQLYEALLEGLLLYLALRWFTAKPRPPMAASALFLCLYALLRFIVEFSREPDAHLGLIAAGLSMGQALSLMMLLVGLPMLYFSLRKNATVS